MSILSRHPDRRAADSAWLGVPADGPWRPAFIVSLLLHGAVAAGFLMLGGPRGQITDGANDAPTNVETVLAIEQPAPPTSEPEPPMPQPPPPEAQPRPAPVSEPSLLPAETRPAPSTFIAPGLVNPSPPNVEPAPAPVPIAQDEPKPVSFAGVSAKRAKRIVYVVDGSGPMVSHRRWVAAQLRQSLSRLAPSQEFQVLVVRIPPAPSDLSAVSRDPEILSFTGPGTPVLTRATPKALSDAVAWLDAVPLRGASDALPGLAQALDLKPDLVFLLSHSFQRSGPEAISTRSNEAVLRELDRLNPRAGGSRAVVIKTIQFMNEDPSGLMQAIAGEHGDGAGSYHVITQSELRTNTPR